MLFSHSSAALYKPREASSPRRRSQSGDPRRRPRDRSKLLHRSHDMAEAASAAATATAEQANGSNGGEQKTRHSEVGHKSLLKSDDLYQVTAVSGHPFLAGKPLPPWLTLPDSVFASAVHPGDERVPARARVHEGAPRGHRQPPMVRHESPPPLGPESELGDIGLIRLGGSMLFLQEPDDDVG